MEMRTNKQKLKSKVQPCTFVRPYEKNITAKAAKFSLLALPFILLPNAFAQTNSETVYKESFSFILNDIEFNENATVYGTAFTETLIGQYKGKTVDLKDLQNIENQISAFYTQALNMKQVQIIVQLPQGNNGIVKIKIHEPNKRIPKEKIQGPNIEAVAFSGNITLEPNSILSIANAYTLKPYSLVNGLNLRKELKNLYSENGVSATISIPEFDPITGDLYIHIEEGFVEKFIEPPVNAIKEIKPVEKAKQPTTQKKLHKISKNIFLFEPAPKDWVEPSWLTKPAKVKTKPQKSKTAPAPKPITQNKQEKVAASVSKAQTETNPANTPPSKTISQTLPQAFESDTEFKETGLGFTLTNRTEDDLLILELVVDGQARSHSIDAYYDYMTDELFIPLGRLSQSLNFPIEVDSQQGKMEGFFLNPNNTFSLNAQTQEIKIQGETLDYPKSGLEFSNHEIYATPKNIQAWFPLELNLIYAEQRLEVTSLTELPFQAFAKRRNIWDNLKNNVRAPHIDAPKHVIERKLISKPHLYGALNVGATKNTDNEITNTANLNMQATADVLQMTGHINANINKDINDNVEVEEVKATLTQVDSAGNLLGFMNATQFELGDVSFQTQPLLNTQSSGRGLFITNKSINAIRDPDNFSLTGNAPAGWDVEIYQNDLILDFQTVDTNGEYRFTALPLRRGENQFTVKIYGPNGEKREYTETYYLGSGTVKQGEFNYDLIATESSNSLFKNNETASDDGLASMSAEYGLFKNFSVLAGAFSGDIYGEEQTAFTTGVRTALWNTDIQADYITQSNEANAYQLNLRRNLSPTADISLNYKAYDGYLQADNPTKSSYGVTLNKNFMFEYIPNIQAQLSVDQEELLTGENRTVIQNQLGTKLSGFHLTNELNTTLRDNVDPTYTGTFSVSYKPLNNYDLRARTNYRITENEAKINQFTFGLNGRLNETTTIRGDLTQTFNKGLDTTALNSQVSWRLNKLDLGFNLGGDDQGNVNASINLSTHLLPEGDSYTFKNSQNAGYGGVQATLKAFIDENNNNKYDAGEQTLEDILFQYKKRGRITRTNEKGMATINGLTPYADNIISVDLLSVKDIYIKPVNESINIVGEPYQSGYIDFPMQYLGEVTGSVEYVEGNTRQPMSGLQLKITDQDKNIIAESVSEFDGYYIFTEVPTGTYTLKPALTPELQEDIQPVKPIKIKVTKNQPYIDMPTLQITAKEKTATQVMDDALLNLQNEAMEPQKPLTE